MTYVSVFIIISMCIKTISSLVSEPLLMEGFYIYIYIYIDR